MRLATQNFFFNLGEINFSVSSPRPTEKTCVFLCVYFFFLCGLTHRQISFNLGEHNFSVRVRPTEKLFLTVNPQKNSIFLSLYFCGYFSEGTPSEKKFSDGIRIFPWVFAPSEKIEIPVVRRGRALKSFFPIYHVTRIALNLYKFFMI